MNSRSRLLMERVKVMGFKTKKIVHFQGVIDLTPEDVPYDLCHPIVQEYVRKAFINPALEITQKHILPGSRIYINLEYVITEEMPQTVSAWYEHLTVALDFTEPEGVTSALNVYITESLI
jgi:hypothetical protein